MKLLKEKYKTWEGARKRASFENSVAASEYRAGYKAKRYHYTVVEETDFDARQDGFSWRVARNTPAEIVMKPGEKDTFAD